MTQQEQQPQHFMAELYRRHERLMYYIAGNYTADAFQREDIVQAALVALMRNEATLRTLSEPARLSYIAAAVRNTAINARKRTQRETAQCVSMEDLPEELPQTQMLGAEIKYLEKERREALLAKFRELPVIIGSFEPLSSKMSVLTKTFWPIILPSFSITKSSSGTKSAQSLSLLSTKCSVQPGA